MDDMIMPAFLPAVRDAIHERQVLSVEYHRLDGVVTARWLHPLHLDFWGHAWTCTAWCELRGDFRVFRVDRLARCAGTGEAFSPEPGRGYDDFLAQRIGQYRRR